MAQANSNFTVVGNLTRDPEIRLTTKQTKYCYVTVAVNKNKDTADFISVLLWETLADNIHKYCHKGDTVAIHGYVGTRKIENRTEIQLTASTFSIVRTKKPETAQPAAAPDPAEDKFEAITNPDPFAPF